MITIAWTNHLLVPFLKNLTTLFYTKVQIPEMYSR